MSNFNYMDGVPVKIAESYKPPPRLYQLPQAIHNKLLLPSEHYQRAPQYDYDFQLERKVLTKIPDWRRMRQQEREARRERIEKHEQQRLRTKITQQRQLLCAVSYPSADEISFSTDSENKEEEGTTMAATSEAISKAAITEIQKKNVISSRQPSSFHNILQPTILSHSSSGNGNLTTPVNTNATILAGGATYGGVDNHLNAFNYKDFENDTSSPFDNIELKTIDDLDILAQVLHNTQLEMGEQQELQQMGNVEEEQQQITKENVQNEESAAKNAEDEVTYAQAAMNLAMVEKTKAALEKVDFNDLSQQLQNANIPNSTTSPATSQQLQQVGTDYGYHVPSIYASSAYMSPLYNGLELQQQQHPTQYANYNAQTTPGGAYSNQNCLYGSSNCNGPSAYYSPTHASQFVSHNANNIWQPIVAPNSTQMLLAPSETAAELSLKWQSAPDILKELRDEVRNSEMRRNRNNSHCLHDSVLQNDDEEEEETTPRASPTKTALQHPATTQYYAKLEAPAQKLAQNISSMGFPLERVAKIAQMFGTDDKQLIIEHLIPFSELVDLGFDENKISQALKKFNNNKEKALEDLIS